METNCITPDGYYVDTNGVWDGNASTIDNIKSFWPGETSSESKKSWEESEIIGNAGKKMEITQQMPGYKIRMENGTISTNLL